MGPILCAICAEEITDDEKLEQLKANQKLYMAAKPTCSDECGPFILKREKTKRKQAGAQKTKSVKRQKTELWRSIRMLIWETNQLNLSLDVEVFKFILDLCQLFSRILTTQ